MSSIIQPLLITAALLLIPLVPASILYFALTPKTSRSSDRQKAEGSMEAPLGVGIIKVRFDVVGSSATYILLLAVAVAVHSKLQTEAAIGDLRAWFVELPVYFRGEDGAHIRANNGELQQVRVALEPNLTLASANTIQFWVVTNNKRFPTARFSLSSLSLESETVDLNDDARVAYDYTSQRITGISPVWLKIGQAYNQSPAVGGNP